MTTAAAPETATGTVPPDTFAVRLAIVRAVEGWNYDQAEAATGISSESWRTWEKSKRRCTDIAGVSEKISRATGLSYGWLMLGGPLDRQPNGAAVIAPQGGPDRRRRPPDATSTGHLHERRRPFFRHPGNPRPRNARATLVKSFGHDD